MGDVFDGSELESRQCHRDNFLFNSQTLVDQLFIKIQSKQKENTGGDV